MLAYRQPVLINRPGPDFNAALTLRNQPVRIIDVPGAIAIQELLERVEWNNMLGDALSFAPHLNWSPLPGVSAKPVLFQFAWGDLSLPNPFETAVVRAANTPGLVSLFRTDFAKVPNMPLKPIRTNLCSISPPRPHRLWWRGPSRRRWPCFFLAMGERTQVNDLVRWPFICDLSSIRRFCPRI